MNTAIEELCTELYTLSGETWKEPYMDWHYNRYKVQVAPKYDLRYLLGKLPRHIKDKRQVFHLIVMNGNTADDTWIVDYYSLWGQKQWYTTDVLLTEARECEDEVVENAACKLAIQLFKHGILKQD